jgi:NAD(P)H dehydrogenase (quinone)
MKKIFLIYGHYNDNSFNSAIKKEFIEEAELKGNKVDVVDLYKEKFDPVFAGESPDEVVLDHRKRIEQSDIIVLVAPIWNFRMPAIVEGWIDKVLAPPWAYRFKKLWGNYGYPIGNLKNKKAVIYNIIYRRYFAVPFVSNEKRKEFLEDVRETARNL